GTSISLFKPEPDGRFSDIPPDDKPGQVIPGAGGAVRVYGAMDWAKNELAQQYDPRQREKALKTLAEWKDSAAIDLLGERLDKDPDHQLRLAAAELLSKSDNPRVGKILEKAIGHADGKVRVTAFQRIFKPLNPALSPL